MNVLPQLTFFKWYCCIPPSQYIICWVQNKWGSDQESKNPSSKTMWLLYKNSSSMWTTVMFFCFFSDGGHLQLLGNPSNEHLSRTPGDTLKLTAFLLFHSSIKYCIEKLPCPYTGCYRYRQDYILAETTVPGPAGSHGQPHQLRPLPSLQQLHLRVSISEHPRLERRDKSLSLFMLYVLRSEDKLADVNSTRQCVGKLAASLFGQLSSSAAKCILVSV